MGSMNRKQGETVKITLKSSDASGGVPIVVSDSNGVDRPVQKWEKLVLDSMEWDIAGTVTVDLTDPGAGVSADATLLGSFSATSSGWASGGEGANVSNGSTPVATASGSGNVEMFGTGRVLTQTTRGPQAGYKSLLTPGGTPGQNF